MSRKKIIQLLGIVIFLIVAAEGVLIYLEERSKSVALAALHDLTALTKTTFPVGQPSVAEIFWRAVGRTEPTKDPWGKFYEISLSTERHNEFVWRSSGPDETMYTKDDLVVRSPFEMPSEQKVTRKKK